MDTNKEKSEPPTKELRNAIKKLEKQLYPKMEPIADSIPTKAEAEDTLMELERAKFIREEAQRMEVKSTNPEFEILLDVLDFPEGFAGFMYDVYRNGEDWKRVTREELDEFRKKYVF